MGCNYCCAQPQSAMLTHVEILKNLNPSQREAVTAPVGPLLVVAGAGSGKTKVLVHRIAHLIHEGADPASILAVTFTNKAAREMKERALALLRHRADARAPFVSTFHALGVHILRRHGAHVDVPQAFTILDESDALAVVKRVLKMLALDPKQFQPARVRSIISTLKNNPADEETAEYPKEILHALRAYEEELERAHALDFDDLLIKTVRLLEQHPDVMAHYHRRWRHMLVDEYQDTNHIQYLLTKLLARGSGSITVVGDSDQAIYSWRGADVGNILTFTEDWPGARVVTLEQNYRSTQMILNAANAIIEKNVSRAEKNLWTARPDAVPLSVTVAENERVEARQVVASIRRFTGNGIPLKDMAVLYRTNAQSRAVEEALITANMPYRLAGGVRFYERREVKDILAYARLSLNPHDTVSRQRVINTPPRGIGKTLAERYVAGESPKTPREAERIRAFEELRAELGELFLQEPTRDFVKAVIKKTGYEEYIRDGTPAGEERWANVLEILTVAAPYHASAPPAGTTSFLEDVALLSDADTVDTSRDAVHLMTVHAAKGLEFEVVFVIGLEEGVFPHALSAMSMPELEEERRLCYVALTRAKTHLYLSMARTRTLYGETSWNEPSRFLKDVPKELFARAVNFDDSDIIGYETEG